MENATPLKDVNGPERGAVKGGHIKGGHISEFPAWGILVWLVLFSAIAFQATRSSWWDKWSLDEHLGVFTLLATAFGSAGVIAGVAVAMVTIQQARNHLVLTSTMRFLERSTEKELLDAIRTVAPHEKSLEQCRHWDGKTWSIVPSPVFSGGGRLLSVAAISSTDVWASGEGGGESALERWNGTAWQFVPGTTFGGELTLLHSIAASSANNIIAVGEYDNPNPLFFAENWNGAKWTFNAPPELGTQAVLTGVAAVAPNEMFAVGYYDPNGAATPQTYATRWNGSTWAQANALNIDPQSSILTNMLNGVAGASSNDVWAVGMYTWLTGDGTPRSLFEHWSGKMFSLDPGPAQLESSNNAASNEMLAVAVLPSGTLWAVGNQSEPGMCCNLTLTAVAQKR